jgi:hypothetical protein
MLKLMKHLSLLTRSGMVTNLKDLLAVAREVEEHIRKVSAVGGGRDGEQHLPMDEIGSRWRVEPQSGVSTTIEKKKSLRQKVESANKLTTSSASPSSSAKTKLETNGSAP